MITEYPQVIDPASNLEPLNITNKKRHLVWKRVENNAPNEEPIFKAAHPSNDEFTGNIPSPINLLQTKCWKL